MKSKGVQIISLFPLLCFELTQGFASHKTFLSMPLIRQKKKLGHRFHVTLLHCLA